MLLSVGLKGHFHPLFNYAGSLVESVGNHDWVEFQNCGQVGSLPPVLNLNTHKVSLGEDAPHGICPYFFKAVSKGTLPGVAGIVAAVAVAMWGKPLTWVPILAGVAAGILTYVLIASEVLKRGT
jgi:hypothetical protein